MLVGHRLGAALTALALLFASLCAWAQHEPDELVSLLGETLWTSRDAYDAAHVLMVPMHAAYQRRDAPRIGAFRDFIQRYLADPSPIDLGRETNLQFSYLVSQFAVLETRNGECSPLAKVAVERLARDVKRELMAPAWEWSMPDFPTMPH